MNYHAQLHFQSENQFNMNNSSFSLPANNSNPTIPRTNKRSRDDHDNDDLSDHLAKKTRHHAEITFPSFASARDFSPATSSASTPASEDVDMMELDHEEQQRRQIQLQVQMHQQRLAMEAQLQQQEAPSSSGCTIISGFNQRLRSQQNVVQTSWPNSGGYF